MEVQVIPGSCVIMGLVEPETRARLVRANRTYDRLKKQFEDARTELATAIVDARREGEKIEDITGLVTYRQTQVNRILKAAGLTDERPRGKS